MAGGGARIRLLESGQVPEGGGAQRIIQTRRGPVWGGRESSGWMSVRGSEKEGGGGGTLHVN